MKITHSFEQTASQTHNKKHLNLFKQQKRIISNREQNVKLYPR